MQAGLQRPQYLLEQSIAEILILYICQSMHLIWKNSRSHLRRHLNRKLLLLCAYQKELRTKTADSYVNMQMQHRLMALDIRCLQAVESILKIMLKQNLESNAEVLSLIFHRDAHHFLLQQQILMKPKKQERQRL